MKKKSERAFSAQFRKELKEYCARTCKSIHINLIVDAPRSLKKPYDCYFVWIYKFYAIEFKVVNGASLSFDVLRPHQKTSLLEVAKAGGKAYVVVLLTRDDCVAFIDIDSYIRMGELFFSIKIEKLADELDKNEAYWGDIISRRKIRGKTMWDFNKFLNEIETDKT